MEILIELLGGLAEAYVEFKLMEALMDIVFCILHFIWNCITYPFTREWKQHVKKRSKVTTRQSEVLGFNWTPRKSSITTPYKGEVVAALFHQQMISFVWNTAQMGKTPLSFSDVKTLIDGVSVGGHAISDVQYVTDLISGNRKLREMVTYGDFDLSKSTATILHRLTTQKNCIDWKTYEKGIKIIKKLPRYDAALIMFLFIMSHRFFSTGNYRVAQLMMNGWLMKHGFNPIDIPAEKAQEFNDKIERFYTTENADEMLVFLDSCYKSTDD